MVVGLPGYRYRSIGIEVFAKFTLPETNSSPLKNGAWNTTFLLGRPIFRGYVSFREGERCFSRGATCGEFSFFKVFTSHLDQVPLHHFFEIFRRNTDHVES